MDLEDRIKRLEKALAGALGYIDVFSRSMTEEERNENALVINQTYYERHSLFEDMKKEILPESDKPLSAVLPTPAAAAAVVEAEKRVDQSEQADRVVRENVNVDLALDTVGKIQNRLNERNTIDIDPKKEDDRG